MLLACLGILTSCVDFDDTTPPVTATVQLVRPDAFVNMTDMSGLTVTLQSEDVTVTATTDASGRVIISDLAPGTYNVSMSSTISHSQYEQYTGQTVGGAIDFIMTGTLNQQALAKDNTLSLQKGGELKPCGSTLTETTPGTIKCNNTINSYAGSTIVFMRNALKNSTLDTKNLTLNGTIKVELLSGYTPKAGDTFTLWTVSGTLSGTPTYDLPELSEGLYWDTTDLMQATGILKITDQIPAGISVPMADRNGRHVYDLKGRLVSRQASSTSVDGLAPGIYIRGGKKVIVR